MASNAVRVPRTGASRTPGVWAVLAMAAGAGALSAQEAPSLPAHFPDYVDASHPIFQLGRPILVAEPLREGERVQLDGRMDEAFWSRAIPAANFIMQDPILGGVPTEPTEVRVVFDQEVLYIGVTAFDSEPDKLLGNTMKRDEFLRADDRFMWTMDTFLDQQTGYFFEMNPSGLMADAVMGPGGSNNREWDGIWDARAHRSEIGWTLEIAIPFRTLNFDPQAPAWGVNFQRTVRRKNEESLWTGHERNQGLRRMSNAGLLVGIRDASQGRGLDLRPYVSANVAEAPGRVPAVDRRGAQDVGLDLFYNITPTLRANLTVNTDFAETEVDQRQVNLTRFPLQFPEKRAFFLEGGTFFDFNGAAPLRPFFSRNVGLDQATGTPQAVDFGAKVTGQAGRQDIGFLMVRTGDGVGLTGEDFGVMRLRRRVLTQSYVGGIYTWRGERGTEADDRHTLGMDFRLATSRFRGGSNLELSGWAIGVTDVAGTGENQAFGARLDYPNDRWSASLDVHEIQAGLTPAVGFIRRRGFRGYNPSLTFGPRPNQHPWIRRLTFGGEMNLATDLENRTLTRELSINAIQVETHSQENFGFQILPTYERLQRDFQISRGVILPGGSDYSFARYRLSGSTANRRILALQGNVSTGGFFSGDRDELVLQLGVRPRPGVTLNLSGEWNNVDLPEGSFQTRLYRLVSDTQYNPRIYLVNNLQYDTVSRLVGWQARLRWIVRPGNDLFLVFQNNWFEPTDDPLSSGFRVLDRRAAAKINYTIQF